MVGPALALSSARSEAGFSLVELLVSMVITTTIMSTVVLVARQVQFSYNSQLDGAAVQQEARYAIEWLVPILRTAGNNPDTITTGTCPTTGTTFRAIRRDPNGDGIQNDIRVHADVNPPNGLLGGSLGLCTEAGEDITIAYDTANRTITRRDNNTEAAAVAMTDTVISNLTFAYLDSNRVATALDGSVAFVRVTVSAQPPNRSLFTNQTRTYTHTAEVHVRLR
jgi:Tfp pilus assembly protein PilW